MMQSNAATETLKERDFKMEKQTNIPVKLVGLDGNAFSILGRCREALRRGRRMDVWAEFHKEATSGDYDHLLCTVMDYFQVDSDEDDDSEDFE